MRCKHEFVIEFEKTKPYPEIVGYTEKGILVQQTQRCGCLVYCHKCGKIKKNFSKKMTKIYANTLQQQDKYMTKEDNDMTFLKYEIMWGKNESESKN